MMMNKTALTLAGLLVTTLTGTAMAAGTADMTIGGTVLAGSCTPTLSSSVADYGTIDVSTLTSTDVKAGNRLGFRHVDLTVTCDSPMKVSILPADNREGTAAFLNSDDEDSSYYGADYYYGLGNTAEGVHIGSYLIYTRASGTTADGLPVDLIWRTHRSDGSGSFMRGREPFNTAEISVAAQGDNHPIAATVFFYPLSISTAVDLMSNLNLTDDTPLDGSATLSLVYL